ncbi:helix-turn-helix domain-containing protein, partial [Streptomyces nojiriensis]
MGGVLWAGPVWAGPVWVETFTGLRMDRFAKLVRVVGERGGEGPGGGRPWCLPLADRVLLVAVYYRTNLTMRQLAPLFGVSPATVCRVIQRLGPLLALEPAPRPVADVDRLWIVDGTLIPVRDRSVGASSRNCRFSANVQVVIDADTRLV